jgi:ribosomal protein S11
MPPYLFAEGVTGITVAVAVRDSAYRLQGVVTVDFTLEGIARFLETVEIVQGGAVALFERDGKLLAGKPGPGRDAATRAMQGAESEVVREGIGTALVRFTGVDWDTQARIEAFARAR